MANITDLDSPLGVYKLINPNLITPSVSGILERDRILFTRYRCGNHYLLVEKGRWSRINRSERICDKCSQNEVQTLSHVLYRCSFTRNIHTHCSNLKEFFDFDRNQCLLALKFIDAKFTI